MLNKKKFNTLGIKNFGAISLNQIPGDKNQLKVIMLEAHTGLYLMKQAKKLLETYQIDESKYTQLVPDFHNTYFEEVYNTLKKKFKLGRVRILLKEPRSTLSWHRDPEPRLHVPIITNLRMQNGYR